MTFGRKIGRICGLCFVLLVACILAAMTICCIVYVFEQAGFESGAVPNLATGLGIIFTGLVVNVLCVFVLLQVRRFDSDPNPGHKLSEQPTA